MIPRRRLILATLAAALLLVSATSLARGHAEVVGTEPADGAVLDRPPDRVQLLFSEPIDSEFLGLAVYAADRRQIDRGDARVSPTDARILEVSLPALDSGTYTGVWRALSLDSHVVRGVFAFTVGAGAAPGRPLDLALPAAGAPFPVESGVRWLTFLTALGLLGGFAFRPLILAPALRSLGAPGHQSDATLVSRWQWIAWPMLALLFAASFAALLIQASSVAGVPLGEVLSGRAITRLLTATRYGELWVARVLLLVGVAGVLAWLSAAPSGGRGAAWWTGAALTAGVLLTLSASGHPSAAPGPIVLAILADWVHLLAGGLWVGGLLQIGLTLPRVLRMTDATSRRRLIGQLVFRFSWLAGLSVATLIGTGVYAGQLYVPNWNALLDTAYGAALSGKLVIIAPLLAIGALNLFVFHPRFRRAGREAPGGPEDAVGQRTFRGLVLAEVILAIGVLAATGVLTGLAPPSSLAREGRPFYETQSTGSYAMTIAVRPNQAGDNQLEVAVADANGLPVADAQRVQLTLTMLDMVMGQREVNLQNAGQGRYVAQGSYLSMTGNWQADVAVRRAGSDEQASFNLRVGQAPGANRPAFSPGRIVLNALNASALLALVALVGVVLILLKRADLRRRPARRQMALIASALLVLGIGVGGVTVTDAYQRSLPNPIPADAASLARGQQVYQTSGCASCHGDTGRGDGLAGRVLRPRPADFRIHMAAGHTDQELFNWISNGVDGTAMPAFGNQFSEQQRWDVINYIRGFANSAGPGLAPPIPSTPLPAPAASGPQAGAGSPAEWVEVARWKDDREQVTEPFTVRGPWRVRWRLRDAAEPFMFMIVLAADRPPRYFPPERSLEGSHEEAQGGTYSLMLHNTTPYEVVVEDWVTS